MYQIQKTLLSFKTESCLRLGSTDNKQSMKQSQFYLEVVVYLGVDQASVKRRLDAGEKIKDLTFGPYCPVLKLPSRVNVRISVCLRKFGRSIPALGFPLCSSCLEHSAGPPGGRHQSAWAPQPPERNKPGTEVSIRAATINPIID